MSVYSSLGFGADICTRGIIVLDVFFTGKAKGKGSEAERETQESWSLGLLQTLQIFKHTVGCFPLTSAGLRLYHDSNR